MEWSKIPGLSQAHMEQWLRTMTSPESPIPAHGFEEGTLEMAYPVLDWELNSQGILHGGVLSTALDTSLGMLCHYYTYPHVLTTVTMHATFLKPIPPGDSFHIHAKLASFGGTLATVTGEVMLEREKTLAAACTATFKVLHHKVNQAAE